MSLACYNRAPIEQLLAPLDFVREPEELRRYLGYRGEASRRPLGAELEVQVARAFELVEAKGYYRIYSIEDRSGSQLTLDGTVITGKVAEFLEAAERVAVFVVTVGEALTERSRLEAQRGDPVAAWVFDAVGSYAAEACAEALSERVNESIGPFQTVSPRYSPGYCGMELSEQAPLFELLDADRIGVRLLPSMLMQPTKSISGLLGIGAGDTYGQKLTPCERCGAIRCSMRRG